MRAAVIIALAIAIGCGGSQKKGGGGVASGSGSASASDAGSGTATGSGSAVADDSPLTRDECAALIGHTLDLAAADAKGALAPQGDEQAAERKKLVDELTEPCIAQTPRSQYVCGMAAKTSDELKRCVQ